MKKTALLLGLIILFGGVFAVCFAPTDYAGQGADTGTLMCEQELNSCSVCTDPDCLICFDGGVGCDTCGNALLAAIAAETCTGDACAVPDCTDLYDCAACLSLDATPCEFRYTDYGSPECWPDESCTACGMAYPFCASKGLGGGCNFNECSGLCFDVWGYAGAGESEGTNACEEGTGGSGACGSCSSVDCITCWATGDSCWYCVEELEDNCAFSCGMPTECNQMSSCGDCLTHSTLDCAWASDGMNYYCMGSMGPDCSGYCSSGYIYCREGGDCDTEMCCGTYQGSAEITPDGSPDRVCVGWPASSYGGQQITFTAYNDWAIDAITITVPAGWTLPGDCTGLGCDGIVNSDKAAAITVSSDTITVDFDPDLPADGVAVITVAGALAAPSSAGASEWVIQSKTVAGLTCMFAEIGSSPDDVVVSECPPVAWWKFDESIGSSVADSSGNGNAATVMGNAAWTTGQISGAVDLDGSTYVDIPDTFGLFDGASDFTVSLWYHAAALEGDDRMLFDARGESRFIIYWDDTLDAIRAGAYDAAEWKYASFTTSDTAGFHMATATYSDTSGLLKLYFDGEYKSEATITTINAHSGDSVIGANGDAIGDYFLGAIDDTRVYDRQLFAYEVQGLFDVATMSYGPVATIELAPTWQRVETDTLVGNSEAYIATCKEAGGRTIPEGESDCVVVFTIGDGCTGTTFDDGTDTVITGGEAGLCLVTATAGAAEETSELIVYETGSAEDPVVGADGDYSFGDLTVSTSSGNDLYVTALDATATGFQGPSGCGPWDINLVGGGTIAISSTNDACSTTLCYTRSPGDPPGQWTAADCSNIVDPALGVGFGSSATAGGQVYTAPAFGLLELGIILLLAAFVGLVTLVRRR